MLVCRLTLPRLTAPNSRADPSTTRTARCGSSSSAWASRLSPSCGTVRWQRTFAPGRPADLTPHCPAYLERTYPLRPSVEDPLALPVQLEGITIDKMREVSSPRVHRRTSSSVSHSESHSPHAETEPMLPLNGHAPASAPSVPRVNKAVLLRRVAMDQIVMCASHLASLALLPSVSLTPSLPSLSQGPHLVHRLPGVHGHDGVLDAVRDLPQGGERAVAHPPHQLEGAAPFSPPLAVITR